MSWSKKSSKNIKLLRNNYWFCFKIKISTIFLIISTKGISYRIKVFNQIISVRPQTSTRLFFNLIMWEIFCLRWAFFFLKILFGSVFCKNKGHLDRLNSLEFRKKSNFRQWKEKGYPRSLLRQRWDQTKLKIIWRWCILGFLFCGLKSFWIKQIWL